MKQTALKYTIKEHLQKAPGSYSGNQYKLCLHLSITLRTLEKYTALKKGSEKCLSSDMYFKIVSYLKINQTELLTS